MSEHIEPSIYDLQTQDVEITYSTTGFTGEPHLTYKAINAERQFFGDDIRVLETEVGKLVSVTLERPHPDIRGKQVTLTLLLPIINIPANLNNLSIQAGAVLTTELLQGFIDLPLEGQLQTHEFMLLTGKVRRELFVAMNATNKAHIFEVLEVQISAEPPMLTVFGNVTSAGWKEPELKPRPALRNGVLEFDFMALPPEDINLQVISPIEATYSLSPAEQNNNHFRVYALQNNKSIFLE